MKYIPISGKNAGKRNSKIILKLLKENPNITGKEISKKTGISLVTVYKHLKKYQ